MCQFAVRYSLVLVTFAVALCLSAPVPVLAWGRDGHETVGYIAASLIIGTNAEKKVKALLHSGETLATAAEWADCAKGINYCQKQPTMELQDFAQHNPHHNR